jgi:hypothetical protein
MKAYELVDQEGYSYGVICASRELTIDLITSLMFAYPEAASFKIKEVLTTSQVCTKLDEALAIFAEENQ